MKTLTCLAAAICLIHCCAETLPAKGKMPEESKPAGIQTPVIQKQISFEKPLRKIELAEAKTMFDAGRAVFVDSRSSLSYGVRHVRGAVNCSLGEFDRQVAALKEKIPMDRTLVTYCGGETCGAAQHTAEKLIQAGYQDVLVFSGGWSAWAQANYPMEP